MRRLLGLAAIAAAPAFAAEFRACTYIAEGTNLAGSPHKGTALIKLLSDTTCEIGWTTGSTRPACA